MLVQRNLFPILLNEMFNDLNNLNRVNYNQLPKYPPIDTYATKDGKNVIEVATTFKPEDIKVDVEDNLITISGEIANKEESNDRNYFYKSISRKSFVRSFKTDYNINKETVVADFENGLLKVTFEPKESKKVSVNVSTSNKMIETNIGENK